MKHLVGMYLAAEWHLWQNLVGQTREHQSNTCRKLAIHLEFFVCLGNSFYHHNQPTCTKKMKGLLAAIFVNAVSLLGIKRNNIK